MIPHFNFLNYETNDQTRLCWTQVCVSTALLLSPIFKKKKQKSQKPQTH